MENKIKRKMFYEVLPKYSNGNIDWKKSIGYSVHFIFHEFEGDVKIIDCITSQQIVIFEYNNVEYDLFYGHFLNCTLSKIFGYRYGKSERQLRKNIPRTSTQLEIGDILKDDTRNMIIIDEHSEIKVRKNGSRTDTFKYYKFHCNICNYENWRLKKTLIDNKCTCQNCRKITTKEVRNNKKNNMFIENLPRWEHGHCKGKINWEKSVGHIIPFNINGVEGSLKILEYYKSEEKLLIEYNNEKHTIGLASIRKGCISHILSN